MPHAAGQLSLCATAKTQCSQINKSKFLKKKVFSLTEKNKYWQGCGATRTLCIVSGLIKCAAIVEKKFFTEWSSNFTSGYLHTRSESRVLKRHIWVSAATAGLFTAAKTGSNPKCPVTDKWVTKCGVNDGVLFGLQKDGNSDTRYNMKDSWRHCAKWNKSGTKRQILHESLHEVPRRGEFRATEGGIVLPWAGEGWGAGREWGFKGYRRGFLCEVRTILEMDGGNGCTVAWMHITELCG